MPESAETEKKRRKDPSGRVLLGICLTVSICIYFLRDLFPRGNKLWWAWILVGIGCLLVAESGIREFNMKNRWSTYIRVIVGVSLAEAGLGFIYGFGELKFIYAFTLFYVPIYTFLFRHRLVKA